METTTDTRRHQMFPVLSDDDLARLERFGNPVSYGDGDHLVRAGSPLGGLVVVRSGHVAVTRRDAAGEEHLVVEHGPGQFVGEISQLADRPALIDARAVGAVEGLAIPAARLRALMVAEADLGERIMRALILRRVGLIEANAGPVIVGPADDGDVLRLQGFLSRNGIPNQRLDPDSDDAARAILARFAIPPEALPIVVCSNGDVLRNPDEQALGRCLGHLRDELSRRAREILHNGRALAAEPRTRKPRLL